MPEKRKGEQAPRDAAADEERERERQRRGATTDPTDDPRKEEGYSQPESSAQKGTPRP